jgi:aspartyl-tRNA(Asn)/glutamyl-tRNA(Gln) amidotransferase subunit C
MGLTLEQVRHVGQLARLELSAEEEELYRSQLSQILVHIEQLQSLDLTGVAPMTHASTEAVLFREDEVVASLGGEAATANAPERIGTRVAVPRIID